MKISILLWAVLSCPFLSTGASAFTLQSMCPDGYHLDKSEMPKKICCIKNDEGPKSCGERTGGCFLNSAKECVFKRADGTTSGCTNPALVKRCCTPKQCEPMPNCAPDAAGRCMKKDSNPPMACPNVTSQMVNGVLTCCKPNSQP